jgi:hypothetical protein
MLLPKTKMKSKLPTAAKKKIVKPHPMTTSKATGSSTMKAPNSSAEEDNMLAKAFVNISTNPIHRSGLKSNDFWDNVCQKWIKLLTTEGTVRDVTHSSVALKLWFQQQIQKR